MIRPRPWIQYLCPNRTVVYFVAVSLLLPAIVPFFSLLSIGIQALVDYYYNQPDVQGDAAIFDVGDQLL